MVLDEEKEYVITIKEYSRNEAVNAFELGYFLYFFRSAYVACLELAEDESLINQFRFSSAIYNDVIWENLGAKDIELPLHHRVIDLWMTDLDQEFDLEFVSISKNSPLKFVAKSAGISLIALTLAVILSGGKANIYEGSFELPPLAVGIRALKDAFHQPQPKPLPSEIKEKNLNSNDRN